MKAVHVEAFPKDVAVETAHLQMLAHASEDKIPHRIVSGADLSKPDIKDVLAAHAGYPNFRGIAKF